MVNGSTGDGLSFRERSEIGDGLGKAWVSGRKSAKRILNRIENFMARRNQID